MKTFLSRWYHRSAAPVAVAAPFDIAVALFTDVGPVREHNEDCIAALNVPRPGPSRQQASLVALADGMGGHQAGELASRLAVDAALQAFAAAEGQAARRLRQALAAANTSVFERAQSDPRFQGMGTTLLLFAPTEQGAHFAWVGDSRLYRWHDGRIERLTRDDTLVMGLLTRGLIDAADMADHPDHSVLTQAVGTHAAIPLPHVQGPVDLLPGDRFLLCSDGIHDVVTDAELALALQAASPDAAVQAIHALALRNGADDNLSIAVVHINAPSESSAPAKAARSTRTEMELTT